MSEYMRELKNDTGYRSIKEQYIETMKKVSNMMDKDVSEANPEEMDKFIMENDDAFEDDKEEEGTQTTAFVSPIQKRETK